MKTSAKIYFPGLNALRFVAASLVIFHHVEQYKFWASLDNSWGLPVVDSLGHMSVSFFFVLSGFLITYLLLAEHQKNGKIALGKFYVRRLLRIWPLYFVIVAVSGATFYFFNSYTFPELNIGYSLFIFACLVFFLPNVLRVVSPNLIGANQLWSVGIEEQFYAIWPILIGRFVNVIIRFLIAFVFIKLAIHVGLLGYLAIWESSSMEKIVKLYALFPVEQMAVGGIGAALIYHGKERLLRFLRNKVTLFISVILVTVIATSGFHIFMMTYVEAILFTIIIVNVIHHQWIYKYLEFGFLKHLGDISYGIYMWHTLVIAALITLAKSFDLLSNPAFSSVLHLSAFLVTVAVAHYSYLYFEKPFLKLKDNFSFDLVSLKRKRV